MTNFKAICLFLLLSYEIFNDNDILMLHEEKNHMNLCLSFSSSLSSEYNNIPFIFDDQLEISLHVLTFSLRLENQRV